jgi:hypothetical protein
MRDWAYNFQVTDLIEKNNILVHTFLVSEGMIEVHKKILVLSKMCLKTESR